MQLFIDIEILYYNIMNRILKLARWLAMSPCNFYCSLLLLNLHHISYIALQGFKLVGVGARAGILLCIAGNEL